MNPPAPYCLFDDDWLTLREPVDHASRAPDPTRTAARWLAALDRDKRRMVDLGSGSGSNVRYLAPRLPGPQHWTLIDHDAGLLARAAHRCRQLFDREGQPTIVQTRTADLAGPPERVLGDARLVTAAALFDLVTASWVARLVAACAVRRAAILFALSIDGSPAFERSGHPTTDADDVFVFTHLATHQERDKGFGPALGARAPAAIEAALAGASYRLCSGRSVWRLDGRHDRLVYTLVAGWRDAAAEQVPAARARIDAWAARRAADICAGRLQLSVPHHDIFAAPADQFVRRVIWP